jgi:glycosyltransferase involved in cell wall biosynthesis
MRILAVIPAYNEAERIADVARRTCAVCETLVVDDGSRDDTRARAAAAGVEVVSHETNLGKTRALETGFSEASRRGFDAVITLDADGQHRPEEIPRFRRAAEAGADVVVGTRMGDVKRMPRVRLWTNRTTSRIVSWLARCRITDSQSGYRLFRIEVVRTVRVRSDRFAGESEILIQAGRKGFSIVEVPVSTLYFGTEGSKIDPFRDTIRFFRLVGRHL